MNFNYSLRIIYANFEHSLHYFNCFSCKHPLLCDFHHVNVSIFNVMWHNLKFKTFLTTPKIIASPPPVKLEKNVVQTYAI